MQYMPILKLQYHSSLSELEFSRKCVAYACDTKEEFAGIADLEEAGKSGEGL